jgi:hypothetical protein
MTKLAVTALHPQPRTNIQFSRIHPSGSDDPNDSDVLEGRNCATACCKQAFAFLVDTDDTYFRNSDNSPGPSNSEGNKRMDSDRSGSNCIGYMRYPNVDRTRVPERRHYY